MSGGHDLREFLAGLLEHFRNLMIARQTGSGELIEASDQYRERYLKEAAAFPVADLLRYQRFLSTTESALRWSAQPRFRLEADLVQLAMMPSAVEVTDVLTRLDALARDRGTAHEEPRRAHPGKSPPVQAAKTAPARQERAAGAPVAGIRQEEVESRWAEYVAKVRSRRVSLGSLLDELRVLGVNGTQVRLACENDFQVSTVTRNRDTLSEIFEEVFHTPARLQPVLVPSGGAPSDEGSGAASADHPVIAALKRELGAEPLDE